MKTYFTVMDSPIDPLTLISNGTAITGIYMQKHSPAPEQSGKAERNDNLPILLAAKHQLIEYFEGNRREFDLLMAPHGTEFQLVVWKELCNIPYGETISYGELAKRIGNPNASRAVGLANGANPISVVVPCHRVIGANGKLTGYGGGLPRKEKLLALEAGLFRP